MTDSCGSLLFEFEINFLSFNTNLKHTHFHAYSSDTVTPLIQALTALHRVDGDPPTKDSPSRDLENELL